MVNNIYDSVYRYFTTLANKGYVKQSEVNKLLLYTLLGELLNNDFGWCIPEEDYTLINKALYCLFGSSCLIPYPDYYSTFNNHTMSGKMYGLTYRSENCNKRLDALEKTVDDILNKDIIIPSDGETIEDFDL